MPPKKNKAMASLMDMMDSEDDLDTAPATRSDQENEPGDKPKRGGRSTSTRGRPAKPRAKQSTSAATKTAGTSKRAPLKEQRNGQHQSDIDELDDAPDMPAARGKHESEADEVDLSTKKQPGRKGRPSTKAKGAVEKLKTVEKDGEFEYTPTKTIQGKSGAKSKGASNDEDVDMGEPDVNDEAVEEPTFSAEETRTETKAKPPSSSRNASRQPTARRKASESDTERGGDPNLRRKVGELTRKLEGMETKYRNLREIGVVEAEANYDRFKKQSEQKNKAANDLIESLRAELEAQKSITQEARSQSSDLSDVRREAAKQKSAVAELESAYAALQGENRALHAKLSATRATSQEPAKAPAGGARGKAVAGRGPGTEDGLQTAQLKEDLYSDLTGLIIRAVEREDAQDIYDCIQTGRNGTLHFKLSIATEKDAAASYEETEFAYEPRLDSNRDKELIDLMPDYLCEDITFSRNNAARFYSRIADTITKKIVD